MNDDESDDAGLWDAVTRDIKPLKGRGGRVSAKKSPPKPRPEKPQEKPVKHMPVRAARTPQGHEVDANTLKRFKKGEMPIEARLDLHGMNQPQAHDALRRFIVSSQKVGYRCVIVVTGKGRGGRAEAQHWTDSEPGVLKRAVPGWLGDPALKPYVLQTSPAQAKHGGSGALYVLLRRKRDYAIPPPPGV